jgi:hypothetical protein
VLGAAQLLQGVGADVMIRDDKAVARDERAAPAVIEADARFLKVIEPLRRGIELIFLLELFCRRIIEKPHPFIGAKRAEAAA